QARSVYQRYHGSTPPDDIKEVIAGLPSATELFRSMVQEMKEARTANLIIDLSQNGGGNSLLSNILVYFLYGKEKLLSLQGKTVEVIKYSPEYFEIFPSPTLEQISSDELFPLAIDDYDLTADYAHRDYPGKEYLEQKFLERVSWMPTFQEEYRSGKYSRYYLPDKVMVLCDAGTFSSAFTVMYYLKQAGAETVGIPSAQAGNCFGDILSFELPNSGLKYNVSRKYFELFPGDSEKGKVLLPDHLLTYDIMASYHFDPASLLFFALDILKQRR
ncbi:MAG: S41 family peptidase, partial [candidate division Zixibacteria bacterium]|nr:S41 family peptidase [candidate division Zixibacteria bacterium]